MSIDYTNLPLTPVPADEDWDSNDDTIVAQIRADYTDEQLASQLELLEDTDRHLQAARSNLIMFSERSDVSDIEELIEEVIGARRYYTKAIDS